MGIGRERERRCGLGMGRGGILRLRCMYLHTFISAYLRDESIPMTTSEGHQPRSPAIDVVSRPRSRTKKWIPTPSGHASNM